MKAEIVTVKLTLKAFFILFTLLLSSSLSSVAFGVPYGLSYSGRLTTVAGAPVEGPINIEVKFFRSETGADEVAVTVPEFTGVSLAEGVFTLNIQLTPANFHAVFPDSLPTYIQVKDTLHDQIYPRQVFSVVPFALKVPVDNSTVGYNSDGKLTMLATDAAGTNVIQTINTSTSETTIDSSHLPNLTGDVTGAVGSTVVTKIQGNSVSNASPNSSDILKWNGSSWAPGTAGGGGTVTSVASGTGLTGGPITGSGTISIANLGVDTAQLKDGSVSAAKIATSAVTFSKIDGTGCVDGNVLQRSGVNWTCGTVAADSHTHGATDITQDATHRFVSDTSITNWGSAYTLTSGATNLGTGDTLIKRDSSGNFAAGTITATLNGTATAAGTATTATTAGNVTGVVAVANGGTGQSSLTSGSLLLGNGSSGVSSTVGTAGQIPISSGSAVSMTTLSGEASLAANGALTLAAGISAAKIGSGNVDNAKFGYLSGVTGAIQSQLNAKQDAITTLAVNKGGTGQAELTSGAILLGNGTSGVLSTGPGTAGQIPVSTGTATAMTSMSGDATIASSGALTIANNAVTSAKINSGSISNSHVNASAAIDVTKLSGAGAGNKGKVLAVDDTGNIAWQRSKDRSCDTGNANDVMVAVGTWCVDKYEASIWSAADGTGTQYFSDGLSSDYYYPDAGNLPASLNRDGSGSSAVYAVSKPDVIPARGLTWYQASVACAMSGKQLIPDSLWQLAATGTSDPGASPGTGGTSGGLSTDAAAARCNTTASGGSGNWTRAANGARPTNRAGATSGDTNACISRFGVHDMVGNLQEWTDMNGQQAGVKSGFTQGMAQYPTMLGKDDITYNINGSANGYNGTTFGWFDGAPAAPCRGGAWDNSTSAGVFTLSLTRSGSASMWYVGFRCARPR